LDIKSTQLENQTNKQAHNIVRKIADEENMLLYTKK